MRPGDVAVIPSWVPHGAHTGDRTCKEIDVFAPPRETCSSTPARRSGRADGREA